MGARLSVAQRESVHVCIALIVGADLPLKEREIKSLIRWVSSQFKEFSPDRCRDLRFWEEVSRKLSDLARSEGVDITKRLKVARHLHWVAQLIAALKIKRARELGGRPQTAGAWVARQSSVCSHAVCASSSSSSVVVPSLAPLSVPTQCPSPAAPSKPRILRRPLPSGSSSHALPSGSHGPPSFSLGPGEEGVEEVLPEPEPPKTIMVAPVTYRRRQGGHVDVHWVPIARSVIRDLCKAQKDFGPESEYFRGQLEASLLEAELTPCDIWQIFRCLLNKSQFSRWEAGWERAVEDLLPSLRADLNLGQDGNGEELTVEHLCGIGEWAKGQQAAELIPADALGQSALAAAEAYYKIISGAPAVPVASILQGPEEPFDDFVLRLQAAVQHEDGDEEFRAQMRVESSSQTCQRTLKSPRLEQRDQPLGRHRPPGLPHITSAAWRDIGLLKTDNGPAYVSREFKIFLQRWGIEHKTGIPYSPTGQAVIERTHQSLKRVLSHLTPAMKMESPLTQLSRALYTLNFLNYAGTHPRPQRHMPGHRQCGKPSGDLSGGDPSPSESVPPLL
uniref:Uncharacterized protein n=1 Tax=Geospiza parvula TaxID=87175 RepID=A0A8U8B1P1_GEOPR